MLYIYKHTKSEKEKVLVRWFQALGFKCTDLPSELGRNGPISSASPKAMDEHAGPNKTKTTKMLRKKKKKYWHSNCKLRSLI